jgi:hypothetical protein
MQRRAPLRSACFFLTTVAVARTAAGQAVPVQDTSTARESFTTAVERTWLYASPSDVAAPLQAVVLSRLSYTSTDSVTRPFASSVATPGAMLEVGGEVGVLPRLSLVATGVTGESGAGAALGAGGTVGLRVALFPASWEATRLAAGGGYLRELSGASGAWGELSLQQDVGRARFVGTVHGEHVLSPGRDALDVMVIAGASYRAAGPLRLGVEYVGQDLEETFDDEAEGGPRHFIGPTASARLLGDRLSLVGGPAFGLNRAPSVLGRMAIGYSF